MRLIKRDRSIIPACDVSPRRYAELVQATSDIPSVGAYKIGATLALTLGLAETVKVARRYTKKPIIYDHQKAATDIPATSPAFMEVLKNSNVDAVILFPLSGPATQTTWIREALKCGLSVIVGGHMTHDRFLHAAGGYIADDAPDRIMALAADEGVQDFVVPGTNIDAIGATAALLRQRQVTPVFYIPGFVAQGGQLGDARAAAGPYWHAIIGRGIYDAPDMRAAALSFATALD